MVLKCFGLIEMEIVLEYGEEIYIRTPNCIFKIKHFVNAYGKDDLEVD